MNSKYYQNNQNMRNKYDDSDSDDDFNEDEYMDDLDVDQQEISSDEIYSANKYGTKSMYNKNNTQDKYSNSGGISKYDIGNPNNIMKTSGYGGLNYGNSGNYGSSSAGLAKYSLDNKKNSYDPYGGIGNMGLGSMGNNMYSSMGRDSYNIDIDLNKIKKESETNKNTVTEATKKFLSNEGKKENKNEKKTNYDYDFDLPKDKESSGNLLNNNKISITNDESKKQKKKRNFMDDLDEQLNEEKKKEEEEEALEQNKYKFSDEDFYNSNKKENESDIYNENFNDNKRIDEDLHAYQSDKEDRSDNYGKISVNKSEIKSEIKSDLNNESNNSDQKDSTISIGKYINNNQADKDYAYENDNSKNQNIEDQSLNEENYSYNNIASSRDFAHSENFSKNLNKKNVKDKNTNKDNSDLQDDISASDNSNIYKRENTNRERKEQTKKLENDYKNINSSSNSYNNKSNEKDAHNKNLNDKSKAKKEENKMQTINSSIDKYDDFENNYNSNVINQTQTENEDDYGKFDHDIDSHMAESNNDPNALQLAKSSLSNTEFKNMVSSSEDIFSNREKDKNISDKYLREKDEMNKKLDYGKDHISDREKEVNDFKDPPTNKENISGKNNFKNINKIQSSNIITNVPANFDNEKNDKKEKQSATALLNESNTPIHLNNLPDNSHNKDTQQSPQYNSDYIQNIIAEEFKKLLTSSAINNILKSSTDTQNNYISQQNQNQEDITSNNININIKSKPINPSHNLISNNFTNFNQTGLKQANREVQDRLKSYVMSSSDNFLIYSDSHNYKMRKNLKDSQIKLIPQFVEDLFIPRTFQTKKEIKEMKLQMALDEERKRREYYEVSYLRAKETIEEHEEKLRKLCKLEIENSELNKLNYESDHKYKELEKDLLNLKSDYDMKVRLVEERVILRESKNESRKVAEIQRQYEISIENLKSDLNEKICELGEFRNKCEMLEKENTKLSMNKISNFENNDKIKELRNENFVLHEKCNEIRSKLERLTAEKEKIERKLQEHEFQQEQELLKEKIISTESKKNLNQNQILTKNNNFTKNNQGSQGIHSSIYNAPTTSSSKPTSDVIFDQLLIEREMTVQESIIKSYSKEIEKLNNDIRLLKNITSGNELGGKFVPNKSLNYTFSNNFNLNKEQDCLNSKSPIQNNFVKESAEEKIKILSKFLSQQFQENNFLSSQSQVSNSNLNQLNLNTVENEFILYEKSNPSADGEIDLESYMKIFEAKLRIPMSKYELVEIFNNFPRSSPNKIRYNDLLNALRSKNPSSFFIQPDPSYIKDIEVKISNYETKLKELEREIENYKIRENENNIKYMDLENEKRELSRQLHSLQENSHEKENLLSSLMKNNFINFTGSNTVNRQEENSNTPAIKKLKEKIKLLEQSNVSNLSEFEKKLNQYEQKFSILKKSFDEKEKTGNSLTSEIIELNKQISSFKEENLILKNKNIEIENYHKLEVSQFQEKLTKYKKNYTNLKEKFEKTEKDKEKIINTFSKNKNIDLNPNIIQNFIINTDNIQEMKQKLEDLEKRNKDRDEHYKQLCFNSNQYQVNKELENLNKKFEIERKEYMKIINQKNSDFLLIKKEFEEIYRELEEIKYSKKIK